MLIGWCKSVDPACLPCIMRRHAMLLASDPKQVALSILMYYTHKRHYKPGVADSHTMIRQEETRIFVRWRTNAAWIAIGRRYYGNPLWPTQRRLSISTLNAPFLLGTRKTLLCIEMNQEEPVHRHPAPQSVSCHHLVHPST